MQENINKIVWTADGKVQYIVKYGCPKPDTIYFYYDARGDRIAKIEVEYTETCKSCGGYYVGWIAQVNKTYYIRDANGEILAIYSGKLNRDCTEYDCYNDDDAADIPLSEWLVYGLKGHGRFATVKPVDISSTTYHTLEILGPEKRFLRTMKFKEYELKDHLGDVRATFNDLKSGDISTGFYLNNVETFNYYPFGMLEPTTPSSSSYRFGYNGMERDDEVKDKRNQYGSSSGSGKGNSYTTHYRSYDPRTTRWWSLDPKPTASESWYVGLGNNPNIFTDIRGDDILGIGEFFEELWTDIVGRRATCLKPGKTGIINDIFSSNKKVSLPNYKGHIQPPGNTCGFQSLSDISIYRNINLSVTGLQRRYNNYRFNPNYTDWRQGASPIILLQVGRDCHLDPKDYIRKGQLVDEQTQLNKKYNWMPYDFTVIIDEGNPIWVLLKLPNKDMMHFVTITGYEYDNINNLFLIYWDSFYGRYDILKDWNSIQPMFSNQERSILYYGIIY